MKVAIMQPYFFPYIGYWQLISAVDTFVIYDEVTFIKQGYINRNNILVNGEKKYLTLETIGASSNTKIKEVRVGRNRKKLLRTLQNAYFKAPYFNTIMPMLESMINNPDDKLSTFLGNQILEICKYLDINTNIIYSSQLDFDNTRSAQDKVIDICTELHSTQYINAIGGSKLYNIDDFDIKNIKLNFIDTQIIEYKQFNNEFVPYLSIIDILMFNSKETIKKMLQKYSLV
ncbi:WbqC family protein [Francisella philomiragia]|uniref:WbqC family protein n=1 Tax=Francisella philomiragia TaxID=28110 RepID=UPI001B8CFC7B|nr:WbqC family protein [Francisella philomiragia]QUE30985.1 WbqC family protein [Francisella philomiragia]